MDDLDIYNDLDSFDEQEQRKSKELLELEEKCEETKKEIEAVQKQNRKLEKKIEIMKTNFQCLLNTARAEINRKDRLIADLRKEKDDICFRRKNVMQKRENEHKQKSKWQQSEDVQNFYQTNGMSGVNVFGGEVDASLNVVSSSSKFQEQLRIHEEENANRISSSSRDNEEVHSKTKHTRDDHREKKPNELPTNDRTQQRSRERDNQRTREHDRERNRDRERDRNKNSNRDHERKDDQGHGRNAESSRERSKHSKHAREHEDRHEHKFRLDRDTAHTSKHSDSRNNPKDSKRRHDERDRVYVKEKSNKSERHETDKHKSDRKHGESRHTKSNKTVESSQSSQSSTKSIHETRTHERLQHAETIDIHSPRSCNMNSSKAITQTIEEKAARQIEANMLIDSTNGDELHLSTPKKVALFDAVFGTSTQRVGNDNGKLFTNVMELLQKGDKTSRENDEQSVVEIKANPIKSQLSENDNLSVTEMSYYFDDNEKTKSEGISESKIENVVNIFKPFGGYVENCIPGLSVTDALMEVEGEAREEKEQENTGKEDVRSKRRKTESRNNQSELRTIQNESSTVGNSKDMQSKKAQKTESQGENGKDADKESGGCEEISKEEQSEGEGKDLLDKNQSESIKEDTERKRADEGKEIVCLESIDEDVLECEVDEHMECLNFSAEDVKVSITKEESKNSRRDECENDPFKLTEMIESDDELMEDIMNENREVSACECVEENEEKRERVEIIEDIRLPVFYELSAQMETIDQAKDNAKCDKDTEKVASINTREDVPSKTVHSDNDHERNDNVRSDDDISVHNDDDDVHNDDDDDTISYIHNNEDNDANTGQLNNENNKDNENTRRDVHNEDEDTMSYVDNYDDNKGENIKGHNHNGDVDDNTERYNDNETKIGNDDDLHNDNDVETYVHNEVKRNILCDDDDVKNGINNECIHNDNDNGNDDHQTDVIYVSNVDNDDILRIDDAKSNDNATSHVCILDNDEVNVDVFNDKEIHNEDNTKDQVNNHNAELYNEDNASNNNLINNDNADVVNRNDVDNADNDDHNDEDDHFDVNDNNDIKISSQEITPTVTSLPAATTTTNTEQVATLEEEHSPLHEIEESTVEAEMDVMFKSMDDKTEERSEFLKEEEEELQRNVNNIQSHNMNENDVTTSEKWESEHMAKNAVITKQKISLPENELHEVTTTTNNNDLELIQSSQESDEIALLEDPSPEKLFLSSDIADKTSKRKTGIQNNLNSKKRKLHVDEIEMSDTEAVTRTTAAMTVIQNGTKERTPSPSGAIFEEESPAVESPGPMRKIRRSGKMRWERHGRRALESSSDDDAAPLNPVKVSTTKRIVKRRHTIAYNMEESQMCGITEQHEETKNNEITTSTAKTADITAPSATPVHEIFQRDVEAAVTLETVNAHVEEDAKFQEIDSRMQSMFQSPAHEGIKLTHVSIASADKSADSSGLFDSTNDRLNCTNLTNLTINETNSCNEQNGAVSTSLLADVSCSSSVNGNSSRETKRISLGTSDYRFEKVSDNVVNLFITRKRNKKRKTKTTNNETNLNV